MQFHDIVKELTLIPRQITHVRSITSSSLEIALFTLFHRSRKVHAWNDVRKPDRRSGCFCIHFHYAVFYLLKEKI